MEPEICVYPNLDDLSRQAAEEIVRIAALAIKKSGLFTIVLSGGSTPRVLYRLLATEYKERIEWNSVHCYWGDERYVPSNDPLSNQGMAREALLNHVPIPSQQVHPMPTYFLHPENAARAYEGILRQTFPDRGTAFDLILLGIGPDGHTASLFPGTPELEEAGKWVVPVEVAHIIPRVRLSLTFPAINSARNVFFLVAGEDKRSVLRSIFRDGKKAKDQYPAARVSPMGRLVWFVDRSTLPEEIVQAS
jgi:6-phosphogluconolactonase